VTAEDPERLGDYAGRRLGERFTLGNGRPEPGRWVMAVRGAAQGTSVDSGSIAETSERAVAPFRTYAAVRDKSRHLVVKPGDTVPVKGMELQVVISEGAPIAKPLAGGGAPNPLCRDVKPQEADASEDARSVGVVVTTGRFRMIDLGHLTWNKENELASPNNMIGTIDLYVPTRHGLNGSGSPALVHALARRDHQQRGQEGRVARALSDDEDVARHRRCVALLRAARRCRAPSGNVRPGRAS
jgi:hypothetical protein